MGRPRAWRDKSDPASLEGVVRSRRITRLLLADFAEESPSIFREKLWLLQGGEMPAARHVGQVSIEHEHEKRPLTKLFAVRWGLTAPRDAACCAPFHR